MLKALVRLLLVLLLGSAHAETVRLTMYDDGLSCPAACDAHVVFAASLNATQFAHRIGTRRPSYGKCDAGSMCEICLESGERQCLHAMYRGNGPHPMTFDFTPAFYEAACQDASAPALLRAKCRSLSAQARSLAGRKNCIAAPSDPQCAGMMAAALQRQEADRAEYDKCMQIGQAAYNAKQPKEKRRSNSCAYEATSTGSNSKGSTWRKLLPGACRKGSFVGRDGLDCCSGSTFHDGPLDLECRDFYPKPQTK